MRCLGLIALARKQLKARAAQPGHRQIFQHMADGKDAEQPAVKAGTFILGRLEVFELQRTLTGMAKARATQIAAWCLGGVVLLKRGINRSVDHKASLAAAVEIQHQKGISPIACRALARMAS